MKGESGVFTDMPRGHGELVSCRRKKNDFNNRPNLPWCKTLLTDCPLLSHDSDRGFLQSHLYSGYHGSTLSQPSTCN